MFRRVGQDLRPIAVPVSEVHPVSGCSDNADLYAADEATSRVRRLYVIRAYRGPDIDNFGTLTVSASNLSGNSATRGGGIYNIFGTLTVNDSTVCGNNASLGADLFHAGGVLINNNSTIGDIFP